MKSFRQNLKFFLTSGAVLVSLFIFSSSYAHAANLVPNPSFETASSNPSLPQSWQKGGWGTNTRALTYPVAGHTGASAAKIEITSYTSGDAKWYFTPMTAHSGEQYSFSDYYMSTTTSYVTIQYQLADGSFKYQDIVAGAVPASNWRQTSATFIVPTYSSPVASLTIFHLINSLGSLTVDDYDLELVPQNPANLLANPSVEAVSSSNVSKPQSWNNSTSAGATATFSYGAPAEDGTKSVSVNISSYSSGAGVKWYPNAISATPNQEYKYSDYYMSTTNSYVTVQFQLSDGSYSYTDLLWLTPSANWKLAQKTFLAPSNAVNMIVLHGIKAVGTLTTDNFSLQAISGGAFSHGMVTFAFHDGLASQYQNARPIMNSHNIDSSYYIITNRLNATGFFTTAEMQTLNSEGNEISPHTRTHPYLTTLSISQAQTEIAGSKSDLAALGATPNSTFAYPYGDWNDAVRQVVIDAGLSGAQVSTAGYNTRNSDKYTLLAQPLKVSTSVSQATGWVDYAMAHNLWLILEIHDVDFSNSTYSIVPQTLTSIADYVTAHNIPVVTMAEGIALMN